MILNGKHFDCIKEDNSPEEQERQWKHSKIIFDTFEKYLRNKGRKESLIERQIRYCSFFIMDYFFVYDDGLSLLESDEKTIRTFLGNWYIRKNWSPKFKEMKEILSTLLAFFEFIHSLRFISNEQYEEIKTVCKDKEWFEKRLGDYKSSDKINFQEWIEEYNYDW